MRRSLPRKLRDLEVNDPMPMNPSRRALAMPSSPIRKLAPLAEAARARGVRVHHLNIGQPDIRTPEPMRAHLASLPEIFAYTPSNGTTEVRHVFARYYTRLGLGIEVSDLLVTTGGSEGLLFAFMACADPGDEALVFEPFYANYSAFAGMAGVHLVPITSRGEDGFHLPPREKWEAVLTPRTRLVVLCNPSNPTGTVYTQGEIEALAAFCRDRKLFFVVDEVYREFAYDGRTAPSALGLAGHEERVIVVDSLSKRYSACGMRLGCLVTKSASILEACSRMAQSRLSSPGLAQLAALGIDEIGPEYTRNAIAEYQHRRDVLYGGLCSIPGVYLQKPEGAFYFVARLPIEDSEDFARFLLRDFALRGETVMVAPAPGFYATPGLGLNEVRIAYVLRAEELASCVEILGAALAAYASGGPRAS